MFWSHPAENGSPPALQSHIQSHIQSKMADLQPSSHVREKSGAICKIRAKYIQRVQRALSPCRSENHIQNHIHAKFRGLTSHLSHLNHIQGSHPGKIQRPVTSEWSHPQSHPDKIQSLPGAHPTAAAPAGSNGNVTATTRSLGPLYCK